MFFILCFSLQCKSWTWSPKPVASIQADYTFMHDFFNILPADPAAVHPAQGMFGVNNVPGRPVKHLRPPGLHPAPVDKNCQKQQDKKQ